MPEINSFGSFFLPGVLGRLPRFLLIPIEASASRLSGVIFFLDGSFKAIFCGITFFSPPLAQVERLPGAPYLPALKTLPPFPQS